MLLATWHSSFFGFEKQAKVAKMLICKIRVHVRIHQSPQAVDHMQWRCMPMEVMAHNIAAVNGGFNASQNCVTAARWHIFGAAGRSLNGIATMQ